jgi:hypothetical protein
MARQITRYDLIETAVHPAEAIDGTRLRVQLCGMDSGTV